jgi:hypothetical protein
MNENPQGNGPSGSAASSATIGFVLGALVGAGLALLFAPESGVRTRRRLTDAGRRLGGAARSTLDHARDAAGDLKEDAAAALEAGREAFADGRRSHEPRPAAPTDVPTDVPTELG